MEPIKLYRYTREGGGVTVSPEKPDVECEELFRLIADENKLLTNGVTETTCIDVDTTEGWWEIDAPIEPEDTTNEDDSSPLDEVIV